MLKSRLEPNEKKEGKKLIELKVFLKPLDSVAGSSLHKDGQFVIREEAAQLR